MSKDQIYSNFFQKPFSTRRAMMIASEMALGVGFLILLFAINKGTWLCGLEYILFKYDYLFRFD